MFEKFSDLQQTHLQKFYYQVMDFLIAIKKQNPKYFFVFGV